LQQEWAQQRLDAEKEQQEYNELCAQKQALAIQLAENEAEQDKLFKYLASVEEEYQKAKAGVQETADLNKRIADLVNKIDGIIKRAADYTETLKTFMEMWK
jgi:DNA sulfur modification protein DndD